MEEQQVRQIVREELANERVGAAETAPMIGQVTREFMELMTKHRLTYREATLIFRDARQCKWPTLQDRG